MNKRGDLEQEKPAEYSIALISAVIIIVGITLLFIYKKLPGLLSTLKNIFGGG